MSKAANFGAVPDGGKFQRKFSQKMTMKKELPFFPEIPKRFDFDTYK